MRFRITALASTLLLTTLVLAGALLVLVQGRLLVDGVDETIERRADDLAALLMAGGADHIDDAGADTAVQVVVDGDVVAASGRLARAAPLAPAPPDGRFQVVSTVSEPAGLDGGYRLLTRRSGTPDGDAVIHVLGDLGDVDEARTILVVALAIALPLIAALSASITWWMVGRTLEPVESIRAEVADITGSDLGRRVPVPPTSDEIGRLATTMNEMLDRVEAAATEQRRFVDDASHELRSPLTRLRTEIEVRLADPDAGDTAVLTGLLDETLALQMLTEDLLYLARSDAAPPTTGMEGASGTDLDDIVLDEASRIGDGVTTDVSGVGEARVLGRAPHLRRAVRNVLVNAARHATTTVTVLLTTSGRRAVLSISDDGPGVEPQDRERVFERFTRLDEARHAEGGGSGLGLAIARDVVVRHRGSIEFVDPPSGVGSTVVIEIPLAASA